MKISLEILQVDMHRLRGMESCNPVITHKAAQTLK